MKIMPLIEVCDHISSTIFKYNVCRLGLSKFFLVQVEIFRSSSKKDRVGYVNTYYHKALDANTVNLHYKYYKLAVFVSKFLDRLRCYLPKSDI